MPPNHIPAFLPVYCRPPNKLVRYDEENFTDGVGNIAIIRNAVFMDKNGKEQTMTAQVMWGKHLPTYRVDYDNLADTLYISNGEPTNATTELDADYLLVRRSNGEVCGITIDGYLDRGEQVAPLILNYLPDFDLSLLVGIKPLDSR